MVRIAMIVFLSAGLGACATVENRDVAVPIDDAGHPSPESSTHSGLRVSGEELGALASPHFGALEFTFANPSDEWVRIKQVTLDFGSPSKDLAASFPAGADLQAVLRATGQREAIMGLNRQTALALLALGGTAASAASRDPGVARAGQVIAVGALSIDATDAALDAVHSVEQAPRLPDSHLLAGPFAIPPGLFVKRWLVVQTKSSAECIDQLLLSYELEGAPPERVWLRYKTESAWQENACARADSSPEHHF